jgi:hypothetical protein
MGSAYHQPVPFQSPLMARAALLLAHRAESSSSARPTLTDRARQLCADLRPRQAAAKARGTSAVQGCLVNYWWVGWVNNG